MKKSYCLEVSGDFACFTRPEMKVERVSYDVMTSMACSQPAMPRSSGAPTHSGENF